MTFVLRPVGGVIFGLIADHCGRRVAVVSSMIGMLVATVGQGALPLLRCCGPTAGHFGLGALPVLRAVQGVSAGGEVGPIVTYFAESAPPGAKRLGTSAFVFSAVLAFMVASIFVQVLLSILGPEQLMDWGWRVPYLFSLLPGFVALWGRNRLEETAEFLAAKRSRACDSEAPPSSAVAEVASRAPRAWVGVAFAITAAPSESASEAPSHAAAALYISIWASAHQALWLSTVN
eukprot:CAMPEP_0170292944 /NCGR_PEP_ID=MMETSP0116_2-20130129/46570_1 /TAXON_ID=400756 /ORGANISM="Durinskia baltica, Strain CSIRO CS-38" /LENGTH=232 /DNA_ID=CAMNT_0010544443 /DNA_START=87 /DNA_END=781 /DNA_ORIENTATION=+